MFTPLLAGSAVGSQEFRTILEPVRDRRLPNVELMQGWADDLDLAKKTVRVEESVLDSKQTVSMIDPGKESPQAEPTSGPAIGRSRIWDVKYDKLVIAVGCYSHTFGTKGVKENAFFLKDVADARRIRTRVLECFEIAALPTTDEKLKRQLLHFAVVGGGPTGVEFSAELRDLVYDDMVKLYPGVRDYVRVTVYDVAPKVLSMFDQSLSQYAADVFKRQNIDIRTNHHVEELRKGLPNVNGIAVPAEDTEGCYTIRTKEDGEVGVGLCVWSTGNMMNPFVRKAVHSTRELPPHSTLVTSRDKPLMGSEWAIKKSNKNGAIAVDDHLRIQLAAQSDNPLAQTVVVKDVFALGDNASVESSHLPATAQVANQQAIWLGKRLNKSDIDEKTFAYHNMGIMAYLGNARGLFQTDGHKGIKGRSAWIIWRGAYVSMAISWRNKVLIPIYW